MNFDKSVYIGSFIMATIIFVAGIFFGMIFERDRATEVSQGIRSLREDLEVMQLSYLFFQVGNVSCQDFEPITSSLYTRLDELGVQLEKYQKEGMFERPEFKQLKGEYTLFSIRTWLTLQNLKSSCPDEFTTILFFYRPGECDGCITQGPVLDYFKYKYGSRLLIFSIDTDFESPIVETIKRNYNVTVTPSLVVDDYVMPGLVEKGRLSGILCDEGLCEN
jgi:hypothetical protein